MKIALQRCCTTPVFLQQYESSTNAILAKLGIEVVDIKEFGCCGYPLKNSSKKAYAACSARNLSLAQERNLNIMTFCNCCYRTLKHVDALMSEDAELRKDINKTLGKEGLRYEGGVKVRHLMEVLYEDIGILKIQKEIVSVYKDLKIAVHYGCHVLRPRELNRFSDPGTRSIFDQLVALTGVLTTPWQSQLECCGSPMLGVDNELSMDLLERKIADARLSGADFLCVACPYCQLQFDRVQRMLISERKGNRPIPSILYTQLLGLALGIDGETLGIEKNELDISGIMNHLTQP